MEDFITTGYNYILFQLKQQKMQTQAKLGNFAETSTVAGSSTSAIGGDQIAGSRSLTNELLSLPGNSSGGGYGG